MPDFKIKVAAEGAAQAAADIGKVASAGEKLRDAAGRFLPKDATPEMIAAAQVAKQLKQETGASGEAAGKAAISHREMHQAISLLGQSAGGALGPIGELAHFLSNPYILGVAGATLALKMLVDQHKAAVEQMNKLRHDEEEHQDSLRKTTSLIKEEMLDTLNKAAIAWQHIDDHIDKIARGLALATASIKDHSKAMQDVAAATESAAEAHIHLLQVEGLLSPEAAEAENLRARQKAEIARQKAENDATQGEIDAKRDAANKAAGESTKQNGIADSMRTQDIEAVQKAREFLEQTTKAHEGAIEQRRVAREKLFGPGWSAEEQAAFYKMTPAEQDALAARQQSTTFSARYTAFRAAEQNVAASDPERAREHLADVERKAEADKAVITSADELAKSQHILAIQYQQQADDMATSLGITITKQGKINAINAGAINDQVFEQWIKQSVANFGSGFPNRPAGWLGPEGAVQQDLAQANTLAHELGRGNRGAVPLIEQLIAAMRSLIASHALNQVQLDACEMEIKNLQGAITARTPH